MPRSFDMSTDYVVSVEEVFRAFSDEQYWLARLAGSGAADAHLDSPQPGGSARGTVTGSILDSPASLTGTATLEPVAESGGARLKLRATVEVRIPLVGGKLENFIGSQLVELLIREQNFTTTWIGETA